MASYVLPICPAGTTLTFGTSSFSAILRRFGWGGITRQSVDARMFSDTPISGTTVRAVTKKAGKYLDPGRITATIRFDPDTTPPWDQDAETITLTFTPDDVTTPGDWEATGFITEFNIVEQAVETDSLMEAQIVVEMSGEITITASA